MWEQNRREIRHTNLIGDNFGVCGRLFFFGFLLVTPAPPCYDLHMPFEDFAETPERQTIVEDIRRTTSNPDYTLNQYQTFDNMDSDPQLDHLPAADPASRSSLIDLLEDEAPTDDDERLDHISDFCHTHNQRGEPATAVSSATLGHVNNIANLAERAWSPTGPTAGLTVEQTRNRIRDLVRISNPTERLARQKQFFGSTPLSLYDMWAFHDEHHAVPFETFTDSREAAVVRLGLGHYDNTGDELVRWTHSLPSNINPFKPTAWDADADNVNWRPGGKTYPLRPDFGDGLSEVVHDRISAREFVTSATPLEV